MDTGARVGYGYGLHVVSRDNIYTVSTHYLPCIYPVSTEYLRSIYTVSTQYLHSISVSTQYLHSIYRVSTQYLPSIYTVSTEYHLPSIYTGEQGPRHRGPGRRGEAGGRGPGGGLGVLRPVQHGLVGN